MSEEETPLSQLDFLNAMEKRAIISSLHAWNRLRDVHDIFMQVYPGHANDRAAALSLAASGARELVAVLERVHDYAAERIGLAFPEEQASI